ncbi:uncharacterized protein LOC110630921 isoform X1 [Manihot esculenta]|uniref:Uncharacterized protein n=2 Tax=Manihot esculenta TaxID=3983 RepID=A0ACB7GG13_MANES|nr:uncharacterized protein LOC110630921 isoform X1 [Manihot esculenta]KAG8638729.1 hypothetical protein MANES_14G055100v8 [Manihot esculenta]
MFGRLRPSSSPLDSLDSPPSKIFKDDPLSIYEATLIKLKLGSQRDLSSSSDETMEIESDCSTVTVSRNSTDSVNPDPILRNSTNVSETYESMVTSPDKEAMAIDTMSTCASNISSPSACQSTSDSKQMESRNMSLHFLFSKYKIARNALSSSVGESMTAASHCSASSSPSSSYSQSFGSTNEQSEHECPSFSTGRHM